MVLEKGFGEILKNGAGLSPENIKYLNNIYTNVEDSTVAFSGQDHLYRQVQKDKKDITQGDIKNFLESKFVYTYHKPYKINFETRKTYIHAPKTQYQADLVDMSRYAKQNNGYKWILSIIDCFSKVLFMYPIKNKSGPEVLKAFQEWFEDEDQPKNIKLQFDEGKEFYNQHLLKWFQEKNINHFSTETPRKAAIVERVQRTIKNRMFKYFTSQGTNYYRWIDVLDDLVANYNNTFHSTIKMKPLDVNKKNTKQVYGNIYGKENKYFKPKFYLNQEVKKQVKHSVFRRGFTPTFERQPYYIDEIVSTNPPSYKLKNYNGNKIKGIFYEPELISYSNPENVFEIEKVIRTRTKDGKKQLYVKWVGFNDNRWINEDDLKDFSKV